MDQQICIDINNLSKKYPQRGNYALEDVNLQIFDGEVFGMLGPNGAGKTTFFSILSGILTPTEGSVTINGYEFSKDREQIKKIFGIVPQDIALYPSLSGRNNLMYIGRMYGLKGKVLSTLVDEYLTMFGFNNNRNDFVKNYSGGMKRRINLLAGILHKPKILMLDEPTVGVDVQTRSVMMEYLKMLNKKEKMTILYTSHHLEEAQNFCDRVGIIDHGKLLCTGTPSQLMQQQNVSNLQEVFLKLTGNVLRD